MEYDILMASLNKQQNMRTAVISVKINKFVDFVTENKFVICEVGTDI
jgi:hypothetical protein